MPTTKAGPISSERLKSFIERIERMIEERQSIQNDIKDLYTEAKHAGYDIRTMREVVKIRAMKPADRAERETLLDVYLHALETVDRIDARLAAGQTQRQIAEAENVSKTTVQRRGPKIARKAEASKMDHTDPTTGEITESGGHISRGTAAVPSEPSSPAEQSVNVDLPSRGASPVEHETDQGEHDGAYSETEEGTPPGDGAGTGCGPASAPAIAKQLRDQIPASTDPDRLERQAADIEAEGDGLDIPPFLKKQPASGREVI